MYSSFCHCHFRLLCFFSFTLFGYFVENNQIAIAFNLLTSNITPYACYVRVRTSESALSLTERSWIVIESNRIPPCIDKLHNGDLKKAIKTEFVGWRWCIVHTVFAAIYSFESLSGIQSSSHMHTTEINAYDSPPPFVPERTTNPNMRNKLKSSLDPVGPSSRKPKNHFFCSATFSVSRIGKLKPTSIIMKKSYCDVFFSFIDFWCSIIRLGLILWLFGDENFKTAVSTQHIHIPTTLTKTEYNTNAQSININILV